jgi:DNA-binding CsgD family transcriptional regulator
VTRGPSDGIVKLSPIAQKEIPMSAAVMTEAGFEAGTSLAFLCEHLVPVADEQEPYARWLMLDLVEAAVRTGSVHEATAYVHAMRQSGATAGSSQMALLSGAAMALIATDADALELFEAALLTPGIERWPFDVARVRLLYGERLRRTRQITMSRVHLAAALETFKRFGAGLWADRATAELRATGMEGQRGQSFGSGALTAREREIAVLASAGLSNKEIGVRLFVSSRTVSAHLYRSFPKLGITSRMGLRSALEQATAPARMASPVPV